MDLRELIFKSEFIPLSESELNKCRMKAYLSFDEFDSLEKFDGIYQYKNSKGKYIKCYILKHRNDNEIIVRNEFGVDICLTKNDLEKL